MHAKGTCSVYVRLYQMGFHTLFGDLQQGKTECAGSLLLQDANAGQHTHKLLQTTACALTTAATGHSDPVMVKRQGGALGGVVSRAFARATLLLLGVCRTSPLPFLNLYMSAKSSCLAWY